jgi:hypothetical protein
LQVSRGEIGDAAREVSSASIAYGSERVAFSGIYTRREPATGEALTAITGEALLRIARSTFSARAETVDRPVGFLDHPNVRSTAHFAVGYMFDVFTRGYRAGLGVNVDYHTQTHGLPSRYGHKPQSIYVFARIRTAGK